MRVGGVAELGFELGKRDRMAHQRHAERQRRGLARVIVRGRADAAERKHDVAARERFHESGGEHCAIVAFVTGPRETEALRPEGRDDVREMTVLALARQDLVADDERADAGWGQGIQCGEGGRVPPA